MCRKERKNKEEKGRYESVSRFIIHLKENHELNSKKKIFLTDYRYIRRKQKNASTLSMYMWKKDYVIQSSWVFSSKYLIITVQCKRLNWVKYEILYRLIRKIFNKTMENFI